MAFRKEDSTSYIWSCEGSLLLELCGRVGERRIGDGVRSEGLELEEEEEEEEE